MRWITPTRIEHATPSQVHQRERERERKKGERERERSIWEKCSPPKKKRRKKEPDTRRAIAHEEYVTECVRVCARERERKREE